MLYKQESEFDFNRALLKGFLSEVTARILRRRHPELASFEEVKSTLKIFGESYRGVRPIPTAAIVGSTTHRYHDFDEAFLPTQSRTKSRWRRVDEALYEHIELPPVQVYQLGQVYFVRDGHHRVSVARERGQEFIDAEVIEIRTTVPLTPADVHEHQYEIAGLRAEFMERTALDTLRPGNNIHFSEPGGYVRLMEHIAVHRYYMGTEAKHPVRWQDAVLDWYDTLYKPIVDVIRERHILEDFPHRTEADLYLWIMDHFYFLREQDESVALEEAAVDFAQNYSMRINKRLVRSVRNAMAGFLSGHAEMEPLVGTMVSEPHPPEESQTEESQ